MSDRSMHVEVNANDGARRRIALWRTMACVLLLVAGCGADPAFESAERANTPAAWEEYLRQHPDGSNAREARERLAARIDDREWFRADEAHKQAAYEAYLRAYPQGIHSHEALLAIANLNLVVPPPKPDAVAEVQLVAPPEPVLRKPSAGAIERASKPAAPARAEPSLVAGAANTAAGGGSTPAPAPAVAPSKPVAAAVVPPASPSAPPPVPAPAAMAHSAASKSEPLPRPAALKPAAAAVAAAPTPTPVPKPGPAAPAPVPAKVAAVLPPARAERHEAPSAQAASPPAGQLSVRAEDARGYRVQLGAFFTEGSATAERVWRQLQSRYATLQGRHPIIAAARSADGRSIYRLQVGGLERDAAEAMCTSLAEQHDPCIVIAPLKGRTP